MLLEGDERRYHARQVKKGVTWAKELVEKVGFAGENDQPTEKHREAEKEQESTENIAGRQRAASADSK